MEIIASEWFIAQKGKIPLGFAETGEIDAHS